MSACHRFRTPPLRDMKARRMRWNSSLNTKAYLYMKERMRVNTRGTRSPSRPDMISFAEIISGLEGLRVPRVFTLILSFMYRYAFVLSEEFQRMRRAFMSRNGGVRNLWHADMLGPLLGSFFLRSYDRGERVHVAMTSRGYSGSMKVSAPHAADTADAVFLLTMAFLLLMIRISA